MNYAHSANCSSLIGPLFPQMLFSVLSDLPAGVVWRRERNCPHNPKVSGSNPPPATNPFNYLPAFATRIWHHLTPELFVSRRHDRRGGRACKQFFESSRDLAAVLGDHVCISHRRARIGVCCTASVVTQRIWFCLGTFCWNVGSN
jgi:hypothetical protein